MSRMDLLLNLSPLNTTVSRKVILLSDTLAVNLLVGLIKKVIDFLYIAVPKGENVVNVTFP